MVQTGGMLVTNHVLSGAALGAVVRKPWIAFPLGFASHLVLDAMPHWGRFEDPDRFMRVAVADGLSGLAAMGAAAVAARPGQRAGVVAGMMGAALPDLNKPALVFFGRSPFPAGFDDFHGRIQDEAPTRFRTHEVPAAAAFVGAFAALCLFGARAARR